MKRLLSATTVVVASALLLAGCGGGGTSTPTDELPTMPTEPPEPQPPTVSELATDVYRLAAAAKADGEQAEEDAAKYAMMLDAVSANGDSATAEANAMKVFNAQSDLMAAIEAAEKAVEAAMDAKEGASDAEIAVLDAAIMTGNTDIETAETSLEAVNDEVDGIDGTTASPMTAASYAKAVGEAVDGVIVLTTLPDSTAVPDPAPDNLVLRTNAVGQTWAEIAAELGKTIMDRNLGTANAVVKVISVGGEELAADNTGAALTGTIGSDGTTAAFYMGIAGAAYCIGDDCAVGDDGEAPDGTYFVPTNAEADDTYVKATGEGATGYEAETMVASYGYWLLDTDTSTEGVQLGLNINSAGTAQTSPALGVTADFADQSATYDGSAVGLSVHKSFDSNGDVTATDSGHFDADVQLTATFGARLGGVASLKGKVYDFQGNAVDSRWSVTLEETALTAQGTFDTAGIAKGDGTDGTWQAQSFGETDMRPDGFYGRFIAGFTDGSVVGAYATNKE